MDTLDRTITDLASAQGHTLSGKDLKVVKQALCNAYIDSVLDGTKMAATAMSPISGSEDTDEDIEDGGDDDGDIMSDDESEDNTDDKGESEKKLKATKVVTSDQPTTHSSAITGYRPGVSGMGQVG